MLRSQNFEGQQPTLQEVKAFLRLDANTIDSFSICSTSLMLDMLAVWAVGKKLCTAYPPMCLLISISETGLVTGIAELTFLIFVRPSRSRRHMELTRSKFFAMPRSCEPL